MGRRRVRARAAGAGAAGQPAPPATAANYAAAMDRGFGVVPAGDQRVTVDTGVVTGDDGVVVTKFFIPAAKAAGGLLLGDERNWSSDPATAARSRFYVTWDVATGKASVTVTHSTLTGGIDVAALRIDAKGRCSQVRSTDLAARSTNEVFVGRDGNTLDVCVSALNSLTNRIGVGAWSADGTLSITPHSARAGASLKTVAPGVRAAQRGRDRSLRRLARQVRRCQTQGGRASRRCARLRRELRRIDGSAHWRRADVRRAWRRVAGCRPARGGGPRRGAGRPCPGRRFGAPLAGGYDIAFHGNGYPAIETYYYPRRVNTAHTLFLRRIDPVGLGSIIDRGGGLGALDLGSYWWCFSGKGGDTDLKSACGFDFDSLNKKRQGEAYYTRLGDAAG